MGSSVFDLVRPVLLLAFIFAALTAIVVSSRKLLDVAIIFGASLAGLAVSLFMAIATGDAASSAHLGTFLLYTGGFLAAVVCIWRRYRPKQLRAESEVQTNPLQVPEISTSRISILGMAIGGIVDVTSTIVFLLAFDIYLMQTHGSAMKAAWAPSIAIIQQVLGFLGSVIGGYVAASIARRNEVLNGLASSFLCICMGVCALAVGRCSLKQSYLVIFSLLFATAGGYLRRAQRKTTSTIQSA